MYHRRRFLAHSALALCGSSSYSASLAAVPDERQPENKVTNGLITEATQKAINQGLAYLAIHRHDDGSFGTGLYRGNVAITSLAALALMSGGHLPGRGQYGPVILGALEFVLSKEQGNQPGYLCNQEASPHGPMYGHGFGTLFLAEVYGSVHSMPLRDRLRSTLKRAVALIVDNQNGEGGWRYNPGSRDADISVTVCQMMALRAARNAGIAIPKSTVDRCVDYVKRCQDREGGFRYMAQGGPPAFARTAAGVAALQSAGIYTGPEIEKGLHYLHQFKPNQASRFPHTLDLHYFYGHYYAAQAMWTAGGTHWSEWYPAIRDELIGRTNRQREGFWLDSICYQYGTAMACIILQIPNNYLPILQK